MIKLYNIQGYKTKVKTKKCEKTPISADLHPEMDESDLLDKYGHNAYQPLIGILQWLYTMERADIQFSVHSLSGFSACPCKEQLKALKKYLVI